MRLSQSYTVNFSDISAFTGVLLSEWPAKRSVQDFGRISNTKGTCTLVSVLRGDILYQSLDINRWLFLVDIGTVLIGEKPEKQAGGHMNS